MSSVIKDLENRTDKILVLLIDDQAMVAEGVRRMLATDPAIAFHYVSDPQQAIESAIKVGPTVILQDLVMPGVNGLDLLHRTAPAMAVAQCAGVADHHFLDHARGRYARQVGTARRRRQRKA